MVAGGVLQAALGRWVRPGGRWVRQASEQLAELFQTTQQNISLHVQNIYAEGEIDENRTHKKYLLVRNEGNRSVKRNISHYNLDMILAIGETAQSITIHSCLNMATKLTKAFAEFVGGCCSGGIQKRMKRLLSADFTVEVD